MRKIFFSSAAWALDIECDFSFAFKQQTSERMADTKEKLWEIATILKRSYWEFLADLRFFPGGVREGLGRAFYLSLMILVCIFPMLLLFMIFSPIRLSQAHAYQLSKRHCSMFYMRSAEAWGQFDLQIDMWDKSDLIHISHVSFKFGSWDQMKEMQFDLTLNAQLWQAAGRVTAYIVLRHSLDLRFRKAN